MSRSGWFVTATDTDAGKTFVTAGLFRQLLRRGLDAFCVKPVQTGCLVGLDGSLTAPDVDVFLAAAGGLLPAELVMELRGRMLCYAYPEPCSPHLAAQRTGVEPDLDVITGHIRSLERTPVLVEGAGGVFTPVSRRCTMLDLMVRLGLPALMVVNNRLGAINQALLGLSALAQRDVVVQGVILTRRLPTGRGGEDETAIRADNARTIERLGCVPVLADIPYQPHFRPGEPGDWELVDEHFARIAERLDVDALLEDSNQ